MSYFDVAPRGKRAHINCRQTLLMWPHTCPTPFEIASVRTMTTQENKATCVQLSGTFRSRIQHDRPEPEKGELHDLVNRLASHSIHYFAVYADRHASAPAPLAPLLEDLARVPSSRLRSALVALLLRHPEYASTVQAVAGGIPADDSTRRLLLLSVVVAAALQCEWRFTLDLYLPDRPRIDAESSAALLGLPSPWQDFGRPCLAAAGRLLREGEVFPYNYEADWENAARRLMAQLVADAR